MPGYNHYPWCTCGWCVKDGGGFTATLPVVAVPWRRTATSCDSYVDPNAICPVCGAEVFFYQSPHGGRVFFDHLEPPWPKHPCTDTYLSRPATFRILASPPKAIGKSRSAAPDGWNPLMPLRSDRVADRERVRLDPEITHFASRYLYIPHNFADGRPCRWRRSVSDPASVEISTFKFDEHGHLGEHRIQVPLWIRNDEHLASLDDDASPDAAALNAIGWSLSFAWRTDDSNWFTAPGVDITSAKTYFLASAEKGFWAAWNNLGVIARDGLGAEPDPRQAFQSFERAAESLEPISLRHLAACYRQGFGVSEDAGQADFLEELATTLESDKPAAPIKPT